MAWVRIHDGAMSNLKIVSLPDSAFRLWVKGLCYCQTALTDGLIPRAALVSLGAKRKDVDTLSAPQVEGRSALWEPHPIGFKVHDYLEWNDCREKVMERQDKAKIRKVFFTDHRLRDELRARDKDLCRYCGIEVKWTDRKGREGATYDHVDPSLPYDQLDNLVIACRGCNSKKCNRTVAAAGMTLRPIPNVIRTSSNQDEIKPALVRFGSNGSSYRSSEKEDALTMRAGALVERYGELYRTHCHGAAYHSRPHLDFPKACELVRTWTDDARLEKLAILVLTTDDDWISRTDRGFGVFASKASWADKNLAEWEKTHGVSA